MFSTLLPFQQENAAGDWIYRMNRIHRMESKLHLDKFDYFALYTNRPISVSIH